MLFDDTAAESCDIQKQTWSEENDPAEHFSAVSLSAVLALACGVLSLFYLINRNLLPLPVLTLCSAAFALWRIRRSEGRLTGGAMARISLTLALAVLVAVPVRDTIYHRELVRQGREFISLVIDAAQKGDSVALSQFKRFQSSRETVDDEIGFWRKQLSDPMSAPEAVQLLGNKVFLAIHNLGENANVTYRRTAAIARDEKNDRDTICLIYAVTYSEHGQTKTFFIPFTAARTRDTKSGVALWKSLGYPKKPIPLEGTSE
ncbi:MAG: hypothetical protein IJJ20_06405 [Thermoguttaceae bacterium]|nr:hypothetical protein [Thermoguttaceae bacterium]